MPRYEIWQLLRTVRGKRAFRLLGEASTASEADSLAARIARRAGVPRGSIVVEDTSRRRWFKRRR